MQSTAFSVVLFFTFTSTLASYNSHYDDDGHASYKFDYGVEDHHTGDIKSHHEVRIGKEVSGVYSLKEADGTTRIVKYTAGPHKGFNAVVQKVGHAVPSTKYEHGGDFGNIGAFDGYRGLALQNGISGFHEGLGTDSSFAVLAGHSGTDFIGASQYKYKR